MPTAPGKTPNAEVERLIENTTGQVTKLNTGLTLLSIEVQLHVKSRTTTTAPGSPAEGDAYVVPSGATGFTGSSTGDIAYYSNGWLHVTPKEGWRAWVESEDIWIRSSASAVWVEDAELGSSAPGLTASTTQTQGQGVLTAVINQVSVCANANDVRTLPAARVGLLCVVANDGAQTLQLFPASGDAIDAGSVNASTTIATGKRRLLMALDSTTWVSFLGA